jgi:hypothetical protein
MKPDPRKLVDKMLESEEDIDINDFMRDQNVIREPEFQWLKMDGKESYAVVLQPRYPGRYVIWCAVVVNTKRGDVYKTTVVSDVSTGHFSANWMTPHPEPDMTPEQRQKLHQLVREPVESFPA